LKKDDESGRQPEFARITGKTAEAEDDDEDD
jgi:hypothetical protein